ncbi:DUF2239 family protein [Reyranella sp.]|uniref:DUF2239 family protein n=1 Tax=Reyranella sp. TaxID=1929291 RepID=UPI003BABB7BD
MKYSSETPSSSFTAFVGSRQVAAGSLASVALALRAAAEEHPGEAMLVFSDATGHVVDLDLRGTEAAVVARLAEQPGPAGAGTTTDAPPAAKRGPGRPRLGVVAREVTLLPRHWDWLGAQPGGASVALRRLVDEARRAAPDAGRIRQAQETAYRFMSAMAGNAPGFEAATRALFAGDRAGFDGALGRWPADVARYAATLAAPAFAATGEAS